MCAKIRLIGFTGVLLMSGWGALGGYLEDLNGRRDRAANPTDTDPSTNLTRRACDWAARKGGVVAGAPHVQYTCGPYWNEQDEYAPPEPSGEEPPFEGGQCPILYRVRLLLDATTGSGTAPQLDAVGPLQSITFSPSSLPANAPSQPLTLTVVNGSGQALTATANAVGGADGVTFEPQIFPLGGLTDDCGDPEPVKTNPAPRSVPPSVLPPDGQPVPIDDPSSPTGVPPIRFPDVDTPYDPWLPIVNPPPGWPTFVLSPSPGDDITPRVGDPVDVPAGGTDDEDVETPEDELPDECIGYAWEFYDIPVNRGGIPGANPERFYEIFGSAQLRVSSRDSAIYDAPVKIDSARGVCYRSDKNLRVRGLSLNSKTSFGPVRVRPVYVVVREG